MLRFTFIVLWIPWLAAAATTDGSALESIGRTDSTCQETLADTGQMKSIDTTALRSLYSRLHFYPSSNVLAKTRPIIVLIPGGPGLSSNTLRPLHGLLQHFDIVYVDPPGIGSGQETFFERLGTLYDDVVEDIAHTLLWKVDSNREIVLFGHSYGGTIAADIAGKYKKTLLPKITGLVMMASAQTYHTVRVMSRRRKAGVGESEDYLKYMNRLVDWKSEVWKGKIIDYAKRNSEPMSEDRLARSLIRSDRSNYVKFLKAQGSLLWTNEESAAAEKLVQNELNYCSPPALRHAQKMWSDDRNGQDATVRSVKRLTDVRVISLIGETDGYYPSENLKEEAKAMGAKAYVFQNGSHFFQLTYASAIIERIYREFGKN